MSNSLVSCFLVEFLASFAVVFYSTYQLNEDKKVFVLNNSLTFFFIILPMMWFSHKISGGHLNPWISIAAIIAGKAPIITCIINILGQIVGAFSGYFTLRMIEPLASQSFIVRANVSEIIIIEGFMVFFICVCFLITSFNRKISRAVYGFVVASLYCAGCLTSGNLFSARFNPAWYLPVYLVEGGFFSVLITQLCTGAVVSVIAGIVYKFMLDNNRSQKEDRTLLDNDETKNLKF